MNLKFKKLIGFKANQLFINYLTAKNSIFSIVGATNNNSSAPAIKAAATFPFRCASLPDSASKVSKIPKLHGPNLKAYHLMVSSSSLTIDKALFKKASTSASLPALASNLANNANFSIITYLNITNLLFKLLFKQSVKIIW